MPRAPARQTGNWKIAYADFLTALVALFIVLWLVKGVPDQGRSELADYFRSGDAMPAAVQIMQSPSRVTASDFARQLADQPAFRDHAGQLSVIADGASVRIEMMDSARAPLFESGASKLTERGQALIARIVPALSLSQWPVMVEGHTDAFPYLAEARADNWHLSTARAQSARLHAVQQGLAGEQILSVAGFADTRPLDPHQPHHPSNRRVSFVLQVRE